MPQTAGAPAGQRDTWTGGQPDAQDTGLGDWLGVLLPQGGAELGGAKTASEKHLYLRGSKVARL